MFYATSEGRTRLSHGFSPEVSEVSCALFPSGSLRPSWSALLDYMLCLAQSTRTCSLHFLSLFCSGRSWVAMDFSDASSDELEEHNFGIQCWNCSFMRILGCTWKYWSMKKNWGELHIRVILLMTSYATKLRPAVLNSILRGTIALCERLHRPTPDARTRSSDADRDMCRGLWYARGVGIMKISSAVCTRCVRIECFFPKGKTA